MVISVNGNKINMPSCYEELTTKQWERIISEWDMDKPIEERDFFKLFNILAGTDFKALEPTDENEVTVWNAVRWIVEQPFTFSEQLPKVLEIEGKIIQIPTKINRLSIGQNIYLKQLIANSKYLEQNISYAVAIYLQPIYDGSKFDSERAKELKMLIEQLPAYLIRPIGFFILSHAQKNGSRRMTNLKKIISNLITRSVNWLQAWRGWKGSTILRT